MGVKETDRLRVARENLKREWERWRETEESEMKEAEIERERRGMESMWRRDGGKKGAEIEEAIEWNRRRQKNKGREVFNCQSVCTQERTSNRHAKRNTWHEGGEREEKETVVEMSFLTARWSSQPSLSNRLLDSWFLTGCWGPQWYR